MCFGLSLDWPQISLQSLVALEYQTWSRRWSNRTATFQRATTLRWVDIYLYAIANHARRNSNAMWALAEVVVMKLTKREQRTPGVSATYTVQRGVPVLLAFQSTTYSSQCRQATPSLGCTTQDSVGRLGRISPVENCKWIRSWRSARPRHTKQR